MYLFSERLQKSQLLNQSTLLYELNETDCYHKADFIHINYKLIEQFSLCHDDFISEKNKNILLGNKLPGNLQTLSTVYAGHQFGVYTSKLGDGRVHILGDLTVENNNTWEIQLKGAGATPFARGNSGRMSLSEAITEYLASEAMAGLGIYSSRGLAILKEKPDNADTDGNYILVRTAHNHLRFGHFEYLHNQEKHQVLKELCDFVIEQFYPQLSDTDEELKYLRFLYALTERTAHLVAQWQAAGFVHSVMNTDNMSVLGLTLDYGTFGFMEAYDPAFCPNENDDTNRYAFDQQVDIARWNCLALAESLTELLPGKQVPAGILQLYRKNYRNYFLEQMRKKLGFMSSVESDEDIINSLLFLLRKHEIDYQYFFRNLSFSRNNASTLHLDEKINWNDEITDWFTTYRQRLSIERFSDIDRGIKMRNCNPRHILRKSLLENVICQAKKGDYNPLNDLLNKLQSPFK